MPRLLVDARVRTTLVRAVIAAACALFLGAVVTEIFSRLFAGQYFVLLVLAVAGIFIGSLVTSRAIRTTAPRASAGTYAAEDATVDTNDARESGVVKWFNRTKGFGFIIRDSGGEVFVHHRNIRGTGRRSLKDGERVRFTVTPHDKGMQAEQVSVTRE
jgi:CspA family cold shock protein